jgi:hypothetical protein
MTTAWTYRPHPEPDERPIGFWVDRTNLDGGCSPVADVYDGEEGEQWARLIATAPEAVDFLIQYLWSEHGICAADDEAAPYSPEQLRDMAQAIVAKARGQSAAERDLDCIAGHDAREARRAERRDG